jgi:hypothetical protein
MGGVGASRFRDLPAAARIEFGHAIERSSSPQARAARVELKPCRGACPIRAQSTDRENRRVTAGAELTRVVFEALAIDRDVQSRAVGCDA